jgi:hypothetical protein
MPTPETDLAGAASASLPREVAVDYLVPVSFILDLEDERILRVLVSDRGVYSLGSCRVAGAPFDGPGAAEAHAVARRESWRGWSARMTPCEHCGWAPDEPEIWDGDQGAHLEAGAKRKVTLEYEVPLSCFVELATESVVRILVWEDAVWTGVCEPIAWVPARPEPRLSEADLELAEELVFGVESPRWELSHIYCPRCKRGQRLHGQPAPNENELLAGPPSSPRWVVGRDSTPIMDSWVATPPAR